MSRRYRHYLDRPEKVIWPKTVVCVSIGHPCQGDVAILELKRDGYDRTGNYTVKGLSQWATVLRRAAECSGGAWFLSWRCAVQWARTKLWEGIEDGSIRLTWDTERRQDKQGGEMPALRPNGDSPNRERPASNVSRMQAAADPYIVIEDPPNIIRFRVGSAPGEITWVDCRNYGVELIGGEISTAQQVYQLAMFWTHMYAISTELKLGSARPTAAGMALHGWRKSYMPRGVYAHTETQALSIEASSYVGGRCEAFRIGAIPFAVGHYDVRSEYGSCMAGESVPIRLREVAIGTGAAKLLRPGMDGGAIATVGIETDEPAYPYHRAGDIIYPVGRYTTTLAGPELGDAIQRGRVKRIDAVATYDCEPACQSYAEAVYSARRRAAHDGDKLSEQWLKAMLVCLPGKLGQKNRQWMTAIDPGPCQPWGAWYGKDHTGTDCRFRAIGGHIQCEYVDGYLPDAIPAIASWITSAGRMYLLKMIRAAGWSHTIYVDTDAIMVDACGAQGLMNAGYNLGHGMGELRAVYRGDGVHIYGIKHYREGGRWARAGVTSGIVPPNVGSGKYSRISTPAEEVRAGSKPAATIIGCSDSATAAYRHGVVGADGVVRPHRLGEW